jgi:DNA polymerase-3 subunit delta'
MNIAPSNNSTLMGYNEIFLNLKNLYDKNLLPNKIIFSGNSGIGKSTFAYHLANYIFSKSEDNKYDTKENLILQKNRSYNLILNNSHPNFFLISNDDDKRNIQISKIREMISFTNKSSFNGDSKIILIDNVEFLNINSINALLKVIEEPNDKIFFFLIHNSKTKILDTLNSRCIKFNFYLKNEDKLKIINKISNSDFYNDLNNDFKNNYNSPGDIISLYNFFKNNNIDLKVSIDDFLKLIIEKRLYKKDLFIKDKLSFFIELYFNKKLIYFKSKDKIYNLYKYFLVKIHECNKYNLDIENILIELNGRLLNE